MSAQPRPLTYVHLGGDAGWHMMPGRRELVSRRTRTSFRELGAGFVLREIDDLWQDEGFAPSPNTEDLSGERRTRYQSYLDSVDWTDPGHVRRALRTFERTAARSEPNLVLRFEALQAIERDGFSVLDEGLRVVIRAPAVELRVGALAALGDPAAVHEGLERISRAVEDGDYAQAIGSSKELVESTAKLVLRECGLPINEKDDLPQLVTQAQMALQVHPTNAPVGPDGSVPVKKILGGAMTITSGLAELRNRGYGTGHGPPGARLGLSARHAHLAVAGARLWCEFVLDTLADPKAPWRRSPGG